jgi:hypothetical protein
MENSDSVDLILETIEKIIKNRVERLDITEILIVDHLFGVFRIVHKYTKKWEKEPNEKGYCHFVKFRQILIESFFAVKNGVFFSKKHEIEPEHEQESKSDKSLKILLPLIDDECDKNAFFNNFHLACKLIVDKMIEDKKSNYFWDALK